MTKSTSNTTTIDWSLLPDSQPHRHDNSSSSSSSSKDRHPTSRRRRRRHRNNNSNNSNHSILSSTFHHLMTMHFILFTAIVVIVATDVMADDGRDCCNSRSSDSVGAGGCNDVNCQRFICGSDPFCCNNWWDWLCATDANSFCDVCQNPTTTGGNQPTTRPLSSPDPPKGVDVLPNLPPSTLPVVAPTPNPPTIVASTPSPPTTTPATTTASFSRQIITPQCDPESPSYAPTTDTVDSCFQTIELCRRDGTTDPYFYSFANDMMTDCFDSCVNYLNPSNYQDGLEQFCTMMDLPPSPPSSTTTTTTNEFCSIVDDAWNGRQDLIDHEQKMLTIMNDEYRNVGITCPDGTTYGRVSNVAMNPQLLCAARMQAWKIVSYLNKYKPDGPYSGWPTNMPSLHVVCLGDGIDDCDAFYERIDKSAYQRTGSVYENAGAGYTTPESIMNGWKTSTSGHCPVLMSQEWPFVQSEVGLAYYEDLNTGWSAHILVLAQQ